MEIKTNIYNKRAQNPTFRAIKTEMAKEAYQDGHIKTRMITKGERNMLHKIAHLCYSLHLSIP